MKEINLTKLTKYSAFRNIAPDDLSRLQQAFDQWLFECAVYSLNNMEESARYVIKYRTAFVRRMKKNQVIFQTFNEFTDFILADFKASLPQSEEKLDITILRNFASFKNIKAEEFIALQEQFPKWLNVIAVSYLKNDHLSYRCMLAYRLDFVNRMKERDEVFNHIDDFKNFIYQDFVSTLPRTDEFFNFQNQIDNINTSLWSAIVNKYKISS